jgi:hypothetical protein
MISRIPSTALKQRRRSQGLETGLPGGFFEAKNPNLGIFWSALEWKMLVYFKVNRDNLWQFGIVSGHLVYFSRFGMFGPRKFWQLWFETPLFFKNPVPLPKWYFDT